MNTALAYEVQKAMLAERLDRASRPPRAELPQPHRQRRRRPGRLELSAPVIVPTQDFTNQMIQRHIYQALPTGCMPW